MPKGYVYAILNAEGLVTYSGRSPDTLANVPQQGAAINRKRIYPMSDERWELRQGDELYVWWHLPEEVALPNGTDERGWRAILDEIVRDLNIPISERDGFRQSVNGIFAYANGRSDTRTAEAIYSAAMQRFHSNAQDNIRLRLFVNHAQFTLYLRKRSEDVLNKT